MGSYSLGSEVHSRKQNVKRMQCTGKDATLIDTSQLPYKYIHALGQKAKGMDTLIDRQRNNCIQTTHMMHRKSHRGSYTEI
ncbi:hypothetical protein SK128_008877, partial [Halocaridina rubra]